jgi:hypothetical protein
MDTVFADSFEAGKNGHTRITQALCKGAARINPVVIRESDHLDPVRDTGRDHRRVVGRLVLIARLLGMAGQVSERVDLKRTGEETCPGGQLQCARAHHVSDAPAVKARRLRSNGLRSKSGAMWRSVPVFCISSIQSAVAALRAAGTRQGRPGSNRPDLSPRPVRDSQTR